ncbi:hypothetical protein E2C01_094793 [Portunus trituberculatus]|uniref:Uncharacterized protein n=1 Tax=Portunus trituberculatus TaxID=210409 RepID=A0A5B7JTF5_PORTR|nr:hypothetical protein [Portunus trituberculatus]
MGFMPTRPTPRPNPSRLSHTRGNPRANSHSSKDQMHTNSRSDPGQFVPLKKKEREKEKKSVSRQLVPVAIRPRPRERVSPRQFVPLDDKLHANSSTGGGSIS